MHNMPVEHDGHTNGGVLLVRPRSKGEILVNIQQRHL